MYWCLCERKGETEWEKVSKSKDSQAAREKKKREGTQDSVHVLLNS